MHKRFIAGEFMRGTKILKTHAIFVEEQFAADYCKGKVGYGYIEVTSNFDYEHADVCDYVLSEDLS